MSASRQLASASDAPTKSSLSNRRPRSVHGLGRRAQGATAMAGEVLEGAGSGGEPGTKEAEALASALIHSPERVQTLCLTSSLSCDA